jgi:hypothetical protein
MVHGGDHQSLGKSNIYTLTPNLLLPRRAPLLRRRCNATAAE